MRYFTAHALPEASCSTNQAPYPIVLYSPGHSVLRAIDAEGGPNLASHGYVVVSVDHFDTTATVFPDGTLLYGDTTSSISPAGTQDRVKDLVYVLDELGRWNTGDPAFAGRLDLTKVAAMGGSWGGATAAEFGRLDNRCKAVIGLDSGAFSSAPQLQQIRQPLLEINASNTSDLAPYSMATQGAICFQISGTDHMQVVACDWHWFFYPSDIAGGREVNRTIHAYTLWFLNKYLKDLNEPMPAPGNYRRVVNLRQK
jgi:pimeloyl-ACP methyl ester carboxylesterase